MRGRGADNNPANRFERLQYDPGNSDVVDAQEQEDHSRRTVRTQFFVDASRTAITTNDSPDIGFTASINPYRGCEHGCAYCYARPTHEYLGFSAGLDFESRILVKKDAPALLEKELMSAKWKPQVISISGVTDCYQPAEKTFRVTRQCIEVLAKFKNPVTLITKNHLVTRDIDLLAGLADLNAAAVFVSVTTLDPDLCGKMEPRTSRPEMRLQAIRELSQAGIPVGVMAAPVVPGLTDHEMPRILEAAAQAGARHAGYVPMRLPGAVQAVFVEWLQRTFPDRAQKVLNRVRDLRGGRLNDPNFTTRMRGQGVFADQLKEMFSLYTRKFGLNQERLDLCTDHFERPAPPPRPGDQLGLF